MAALFVDIAVASQESPSELRIPAFDTHSFGEDKCTTSDPRRSSAFCPVSLTRQLAQPSDAAR